MYQLTIEKNDALGEDEEAENTWEWILELNGEVIASDNGEMAEDCMRDAAHYITN